MSAIHPMELVRGVFAGRFAFRARRWDGNVRIFEFAPARFEPLPHAWSRILGLAAYGIGNDDVTDLLGLSASSVSDQLSAACARIGARRMDVLALGPLLEGSPCAIASEGAGARLILRAPDVVWRALSETEKDIAKLVADSAQTSVIALARGRSERTIANQRAAMYAKLRVRSQRELVLRLYGGALIAIDERAIARLECALPQSGELAAAQVA
jgi:DNA-binding CsgD family transcriptional regulator